MNTTVAHAPGRVELLGNHTDYNDGYVLSAAINMGMTLRGSALPDGQIILNDPGFKASATVSLHDIDREKLETWVRYPIGVVVSLQKEGFEVKGFQAEISNNLPMGAGLSSSAAFEVATALLLKKLYGYEITPLQLAKICKRAENEFVGVNCGLLDQVSSVFGKQNHAVFLDCRNETVENIAFPDHVELLITNSMVKHELVGGEYNERRAQCFEAAAKLGAKALRDVTSAQLEAAKNDLPLLAYKRAAHVVGENERVQKGIEYLRAGHAEKFGELMFQSHESSKHNFENSTQELDILVDIAKEEPGVLGSRLTGGGFGGATVSLIEKNAAERISASITRKYKERTGVDCKTFLCEIADGAH
jgi:galactokinase